MPSRLDHPVLTVDVGLIHKVDTSNVENLFSMWTVFSRCAGSLEEGRRLENLSWRLWTRETFCCAPSEVDTTAPISIAVRGSDSQCSADLPDLSGSVDSLADEEAIEFEAETNSTSAPVDIARPHIARTDSTSSQSRGRERHITPDNLEKMVLTIKEKKELAPLDTHHPYLTALPRDAEDSNGSATSSPSPAPPPSDLPAAESGSASPKLSQASASTESSNGMAEKRSTTSVVRGFSPSHISSSYRSIPLLNEPSSIPSPTHPTASTGPQPKKQSTMFALGASSQSDNSYDQPSSLERNVQRVQPVKKGAKFTLGASSNEDDSSVKESIPSVSTRSSLSAALRKTKDQLQAQRQISFRNELANRIIQEESAIESDSETDDDDMDESAIDDEDDSSEWEDSVEESGKSSIDEKTFFQRVDSRPNLTSRRSMLTTMLHQKDRAQEMAKIASRSTPAMQRSRTTSPNGPSLVGSPDSDDAGPLMMKTAAGLKTIQEIPRSSAKPIMTSSNSSLGHQAALSPKTTRRNMLATELTQSLRRHLLWERQHQNNAQKALQRRHTAHDALNSLKQFPEQPYMGAPAQAPKEKEEPHASWNQYFGYGLGEYHSKGW